ncbi:helix-hairpin-helix domain-containing protein [bacterium]|nr:helix-hairpin-helix domain-containing protein [bacterium]
MTRHTPHDAAARPGIALIAVLAILTVLAILSVAFSVMIELERTTSRVNMDKMQADMLAESAFHHALTLLRKDAEEQCAWDDASEQWAASFRPVPGYTSDTVNVDGLPGATPGDARWIHVHRSDGGLVGRYAVLIEDEAGKINANAAAALSSQMQNQGIGPFELLITDGRSAGLPVQPSFAREMLRYRYGRDLRPGRADADDNLTASYYAADEIDNNANGLIDEPDEGIDEQEESDADNPRWDDRVFMTAEEVLHHCAPNGRRLPESAHRLLNKYATVHSRARDIFWDARDGRWRRQINVNAASKDQIRAYLSRANEESRFEASARNMRVLAANLMDYRDENNVLTTLGSEYGVEAVCFNEVMANDGSFTQEADQDGGEWGRYERIVRYGYWYNPYDLSSFDTVARQDRYGWEVSRLGTLGSAGSRSFLTNGVEVAMRTTELTLGSPTSFYRSRTRFNEFERVLNDIGWPQDLWRNAYLTIQYEPGRYRAYPIAGNDTRRTLYVGTPDLETYNQLARLVASNATVRIETFWHRDIAMWCILPEQSDHWSIPTEVVQGVTPPANLYYTVYIGDQNFNGTVSDGNIRGAFNGVYRSLSGYSSRPYKGFCQTLDVDGNAMQYSATRMAELHQRDLKGSTLELPQGAERVWLLRTPYLDGRPVRARNGFIHVLLTSSRDCGVGVGRVRQSAPEAFGSKNCFDVAYIMRPDIIELINISERPITLRNWRVVINTGSYADQVGVIDSAVHYSTIRRGRYEDPNPAIPANGYFYLTNNQRIFDEDYGSPKNGVWGNGSGETFPCFELPDVLWGVRYRIASATRSTLRLQGARWRRNQMQGEMVEFHSPRPAPGDRNGVSGIRKSVRGNGSSSLDFGTVDLALDGVQAGDDAIILGMPHQGGFLSMTLKNEYGQVTARTIEYGSVESREINYSTEKLDPTHYTWIKSPRPTIGGSEQLARNRSYRTSSYIPPHVKDNRFASIGEIQRVRKAEDWQNIGYEQRGRPSTKVLKSIAKYFTVSGVRLDPEEEGVHTGGWKPAFGEVRNAAVDRILSSGMNWEQGVWVDHSLRMVSGDQKGEKFPVTANSDNSLSVAGYSVPNGTQLRARPGDRFSVGPGYATPFYYTRQNGDEGIWEWKHKGLDRVSYGLYLSGLNDSIDTTEFLEENHNAVLNVAVYNFRTAAFDDMPLLAERKAEAAGDPYHLTSLNRQFQYDKTDGVYCGRIYPDHISADHGIRLKLTALNLNSPRCSGFAWFDYAYLAPGTVIGKVNVNTAGERILRSMGGVTPAVAANIMRGRNAGGRDVLKPYRNISDLLDVQGLTPEIFSRICNLVTTRSDQFRMLIIAQTVSDVKNDGVFVPGQGDRVLAQRNAEFVVDRSALSDDDAETTAFRILYRQ